MALFLIYPDVAVFNKRDLVRRLQDIAALLQEVSTLLDGLPQGEAASPQTFAILEQTVARLYPATSEVAPVATERPSVHPFEWLLIPGHRGLAQVADDLQNMADRLVNPLILETARYLGNGQLLPPVDGPLEGDPQADYDAMFGFLMKLPVSVPPHRYAHLAECEHSHSSLAVYFSVTQIEARRPIIKCTVCETVSQAAVLVPNQQLSAQEKRKIFQSVLCRLCYNDAFNGFDGFHYRSNLEEEDSPEEEEQQQPQTTVRTVVQEPPPDAGRLDDNCLCLKPLGTHGRIAILDRCGHVFGESCLRGSLTPITEFSGFCPTCREIWFKAIIFASTNAPEAKLAITDRNYRKYMASRVFCFGHSDSVYFHV